MSKTSRAKVPAVRNHAVEAVRSDLAYAEFLPAAVAISARPAPRAVPVLIAVIIAAIAVAIAWSAFSYLDVYTNAAGRVRSSVRPFVVQPVENGRVEQINVANGAEVKAGDILITLDATEVKASLDAARSNWFSWLAEVERRKQALEAAGKGDWLGPPPKFTQDIPLNVVARETAAYKADIETLAASVAALKAGKDEAEARQIRFETVIAAQDHLKSILNEKADMKETLLSSGVSTRAALLTAEEDRVRLDAELANNRAQLNETKANIRNLAEQKSQTISAFIATQSQGIQSAERQIEQLDQEIIKQQARLERTTLRAPIEGTIQQLAVNGPGQVVSAAQTLMVIVPKNAALIVEALIPSAEIGFVKPGDEVTLKADAFPFTRYGAFSGHVASISRDAVTIQNAQALQDASTAASGGANVNPSGVPEVNGLFFVAKIELESPEIVAGETRLRLEPGMTVRAEIKTESRRVIDYILSPVKDVLSSSGHER